MHAVSRLVLHPLIPNIQVSWVKLGADGRGRVPQRRRQRSRRHLDERKHLAGRRHRARPGVRARTDGRPDRCARPRAAPAHHALSRRAGRAPRSILPGAGPCAADFRARAASARRRWRGDSCTRNPKSKIAVLGGTGKEGSGLALRWADAGHHIFIGSRSPERAQDAAAAINARVGADLAQGTDNLAGRATCGDRGADGALCRSAFDAGRGQGCAGRKNPGRRHRAARAAAGRPRPAARRRLGRGQGAGDARTGRARRVRVPECLGGAAGRARPRHRLRRAGVRRRPRGARTGHRAGAARRHARVPRRSAGELRGGRGADLGADHHQPAIQGEAFRHRHHRPFGGVRRMPSPARKAAAQARRRTQHISAGGNSAGTSRATTSPT